MVRGPFAGDGEATAGIEKLGVPAFVFPLLRRLGEAAVGAEAGAVGINPFPQAGPRADQGFVGDFDVGERRGVETVFGIGGRRGVALWFVTALGDDEAVVFVRECGDEFRDNHRVAGRGQLRERHAALGVLRAFAGVDEAEEEMFAELLLVGSEVVEDFVGVFFEGTRKPAHRPVGVVGKLPTVEAFPPERRKGMLEQRESTGLPADIRDEFVHEAGVEVRPRPVRGDFDGLPEFRLAHGADEELVLIHHAGQFLKPGDLRVEVRAHGEDEDDRSAAFAGGIEERREERGAQPGFVAFREDFLELVHEQEHAPGRGGIGDKLPGGAMEGGRVGGQFLQMGGNGSEVRAAGGCIEESDFQAFERVRSRSQRRDKEPVFAAFDRAFLERCIEAGAGETGFAAARRAEDGDKARGFAAGPERLADVVHQPFGDGRASEKEVGIADVEVFEAALGAGCRGSGRNTFVVRLAANAKNEAAECRFVIQGVVEFNPSGVDEEIRERTAISAFGSR